MGLQNFFLYSASETKHTHENFFQLSSLEEKIFQAEFLLIRSRHCLQLVDTIRILTTVGTNYAIWVDSRQYMTLDIVSKAFPLLREDPLERSCMPHTEYSFNTPFSLGMRIRRRGYNVSSHETVLEYIKNECTSKKQTNKIFQTHKRHDSISTRFSLIKFT